METGTTLLDKMRRVLWLTSLRSCNNSILEQNLRIWQGNAGGSGKCFSLLPCENFSEIWTGCECWKVSVHTSLAQTQNLENKPPIIILVLNRLQSLGLFSPAIRNPCDTGHKSLRKLNLCPEQHDFFSSGLGGIQGKQHHWNNEEVVV